MTRSASTTISDGALHRDGDRRRPARHGRGPLRTMGSDPIGGGANSLTSDLLGDLANGPTFCDNLVEVELAEL